MATMDLGRVVGKSAYEIAVDNGFEGTEQEWLDSMNYDDDIKSLQENKVDKVEGKELSSNDFTDEEKTKLASLNNYDDSDLQNQITQEIEDRTNADNEIKDLITSTVDLAIANVVNDAPEDFNTLKEMSDWISEHSEDASAMNSAIQTNKNNLSAEITNRKNADTTLQNAINNKVDKVSGKGLSTNDYTTAEKNKLAGLSNYDDTSLKTLINGKADKSHTHKTVIIKSDGTTNSKYYLIAKTLGTDIAYNVDSLYINGSDYVNHLFEGVIRTRAGNRLYHYGKDNLPISFYLQSDGTINIYWTEVATYNRVVLDLKGTINITTYTGNLTAVDTPSGTLMTFTDYDWKRFTPDERTKLDGLKNYNKRMSNSTGATKYYVIKNIPSNNPIQIMGSVSRLDSVDSVFNFTATGYSATQMKIVGIWNNSNMYQQNWKPLPFKFFRQSDSTYNLWVEIPSYSVMNAVMTTYSGANYNFVESSFNDNGTEAPQEMSIKAHQDLDGNDIRAFYATKTELNGKADISHTHDDRYYTESEINTKLANKLDKTGTASKATKLETARTINVQDHDGTNNGTGASFDGSGNATIKLPAQANIIASCATHIPIGKIDSEVGAIWIGE